MQLFVNSWQITCAFLCFCDMRLIFGRQNSSRPSGTVARAFVEATKVQLSLCLGALTGLKIT
jgi:hypothetical protein